MKRNKIVLSVAVVLGSILLATGCKAKLKNGEEVAIKVNGKNITADTLYKELKKKYAKEIIVDDIDKLIFDVIYKDDKEIEEQVNSQVEYIKSQYKDNLEETLENAGYDDIDELKDVLRLSYQRNKAVENYIKENIKDSDIKKYYEEKSVGDISAKHILIKVKSDDEDEGLSDDEAKEKAKELIKKLDEGANFDDLAKENSEDPGSASNGGDLGYFNKGQMVEEFEKAAYALKLNEYTKEPVKTSYGYHIILKTGEKEKESLDQLKDSIKEKIYQEKKDDNLTQIIALEEIRKNYKLTFKDSKLKKYYKEYIEKQKENASN